MNILRNHTAIYTNIPSSPHIPTPTQSFMQNLSITVVRTIIGSIPLLCVLLFIILTYTFTGSIIFSNLRTGEGINLSRVNFDGTFSSFSIAIRVMTGEDWHHLLWDAMVSGETSYCLVIVLGRLVL